ncbi:MAG: aspartate ammonia-lyase [bacterium]
MKTRKEKDSLGELEVPANAYYGVQTARAVANFPISGLKPYPELVEAYACIKKAAAMVNSRLGLLSGKRARAIIRAADEVLRGKFRDQFVVDPFQAGAGTSHNMNVNEVIANRAIEILGGRRGDYSLVHPNDHVNMSQSTNDTFPTAMRISALMKEKKLLPELDALAGAFRAKGREFGGILKSGRTHLQDATPVTLGQEFTAFADTLAKAENRIRAVSRRLCELNIGGTATGTGLNSHPRYAAEMAKTLAALTGLPLRRGRNLMELCQSTTDVADYSGAIKLLSLDLMKTANDLRLMSSGPTTGLGEIRLPPVQPGSSIMPGKVNPVICEMTNMVCCQVIGNDLAVSMASQASQLQLNVMMPGMIFALLFSMEILTSAMKVLRGRCVEGIAARPERCRRYFEISQGLATVLNPIIGYGRAAEVVKESDRTGETILEVIRRRKILTEAEIKKYFSPGRLTRPGRIK